jgi:hypothetical protein
MPRRKERKPPDGQNPQGVRMSIWTMAATQEIHIEDRQSP